MKKILSYILFFTSIFVLSIPQGFTAINFSIDPIKYELEMAPGQSLTLTASIQNNWVSTITMPTAVSDFQANGSGGTPSFVRKSELVFPDQELSSWITLSATWVTMAPGERATINFTIDVPTDAIPWGHYGAVIFKNAWSEASAGWEVGINVDYGILILITVDGDIIVDGEVWDLSIIWGATWRWDPKDTNENEEEISEWNEETDNNNEEINNNTILGITPPDGTFDTCPLWDFTSSNFDGKCFDNPFLPEEKEEIPKNEMIPLWEQEEFGVDFQVPFKNTGTTHVKPTGKIILEDSQWKQLKAIWRELIVSDLGVIMWENIVDYIPINDTDGNVLPNTKRVFEWNWEWFPYKTYDDVGNEIIQHWNPSEYYTKQNKEEAGFLMFWERVCEAKRHEKITAFIDMSYTDENGEVVEFNSAKDFYINYTEEYVGINPYVVIPIVIFLSLLWFYMLWRFLCLLGNKKRKCKHCDTVIRKTWKVCPKCKKKLKK